MTKSKLRALYLPHDMTKAKYYRNRCAIKSSNGNNNGDNRSCLDVLAARACVVVVMKLDSPPQLFKSIQPLCVVSSPFSHFCSLVKYYLAVYTYPFQCEILIARLCLSSFSSRLARTWDAHEPRDGHLEILQD